MGNYENLKQSITEVIRNNGNQEITGAVLQSALLTIISTVGANATFAGIATPTTNPGTPDGPVFYLASESGTYTNFNGVTLSNEVCILSNNNGSWVKANTGLATQQQFTELKNILKLSTAEIVNDITVDDSVISFKPEDTKVFINIISNEGQLQNIEVPMSEESQRVFDLSEKPILAYNTVDRVISAIDFNSMNNNHIILMYYSISKRVMVRGALMNRIFDYKISNIQALIQDTKNEISNIKNILKTKNVASPQSLTNYISFGVVTQNWTYSSILKKVKEQGSIYVESIKWMAFDGITPNVQGNPTEIEIYGLIIGDNNIVEDIGLKKTIVLQESWKEVDENQKVWYNIPINEELNYAPAITYFWYSTTRFSDGIIRGGLTIEDSSQLLQPYLYFYIRDIRPLFEIQSKLEKKIDDNSEAIKVLSNKDPLSVFKNKKWGVLGDSISFGQYSEESYSKILSDELGMELYNVSVPGWTLSGIYDQIDNLPKDLDIITVMGGTNNYKVTGIEGELGEPLVLDDETGKYILNTDNTVTGWLNKILTKLREKYTTALIILITPPRSSRMFDDSDSSKPFNLLDLGNAYMTVSNLHGVPVFDLARECPINSNDEKQAEIYYTRTYEESSGVMVRDITHPTIEGHRIIAKYIKCKFSQFIYLI